MFDHENMFCNDKKNGREMQNIRRRVNLIIEKAL